MHVDKRSPEKYVANKGYESAQKNLAKKFLQKKHRRRGEPNGDILCGVFPTTRNTSGGAVAADQRGIFLRY